jgi:hypothetical protein
MPKLWLGDTSSTVATNPLQISFADFSSAFGDRRVRFLADALPALGTERPATGGLQVLFEIDSTEVRPPLFMRTGIYLIEGLSPTLAREALRKIGVAA